MEKCEVRRWVIENLDGTIAVSPWIDTFEKVIEASAYDALKAENSKLRAALEKIENKTIWNNNSLEQDFHEANEIAREALAGGGEGGGNEMAM